MTSATMAKATGPGPATTKEPKTKIRTRSDRVTTALTGPAQGAAPMAHRPHDRRAVKAATAMTTAMGLPTARPVRAAETVAHRAVAPTIGHRAVLAARSRSRGEETVLAK